MSLTRRDFNKWVALAGVAPAIGVPGIGAAAQAAWKLPQARRRLRLEPFDYGGVRLLDGMFKRQFDATCEHFRRIPDDALLWGFRKRAGLPAPGASLDGWYEADVFNAFGQYLAGIARMAKAADDTSLRDKAIFLMREWAKTIEPDGFFFYSRQTNAHHYFYEKMMGGLNDIREFLGEEEALVHAGRITRWAIANLDRTNRNATADDPGGDGGVGSNEWYTLSENLYRAYLLSGDPMFKEFAQVWHYDKYWKGHADGRPEVHHVHAYSHVNTLSSAAMAYAVSGEPAFLRTIVNAHGFLQETQCFATGGYGPKEQLLLDDGSLGRSLEKEENSFETPCGSWAGFKLSRYLIGFTGEASYGDWMERLAYNGIGAALPMGEGDHAGHTFYYADYRLGAGRKTYYGSHWPCCSGTYPQAVADYHNLIYFKDRESLYVNLFIASEVAWTHKGQDIVVRQRTEYPESGSITLTVTPQEEVEFALQVRIPGWSKGGVRVRVNGEEARIAAVPGRWGAIRRRWKPGDVVELDMPLPMSFVPVDRVHPRRVAAVRGPVVLVRVGSPPPPADFAQWQASAAGPLVLTAPSRSGVTERFVPFYRVAQDEPYSMYFDL